MNLVVANDNCPQKTTELKDWTRKTTKRSQ